MTARTVLLVLAAVLAVSAENTRLKEVFSWQTVEFKFPKDSDRADAIKSGDFIPENNLPLGLDVWRDKLFITVPRWKAGVVSSLNYVDISDLEIPEPSDDDEEPTPIIEIDEEEPEEEPPEEPEEEPPEEQEEEPDEDGGLLDTVGDLTEPVTDLVGGEDGVLGGVTDTVGDLLGGGDDDDEDEEGDDGLLDGVTDTVGDLTDPVTDLLGGGDDDDEDEEEEDDGLLDGVTDTVGDLTDPVTDLLGGGDDDDEDDEGEEDGDGPLDAVTDTVGDLTEPVTDLLGGGDDDDEDEEEGDGPLDAVTDTVGDLTEPVTDLLGGDGDDNDDEEEDDGPLDAVTDTVGDLTDPVTDLVGGDDDDEDETEDDGPLDAVTDTVGDLTEPVTDLVGDDNDEDSGSNDDEEPVDNVTEPAITVDSEESDEDESSSEEESSEEAEVETRFNSLRLGLRKYGSLNLTTCEGESCVKTPRKKKIKTATKKSKSKNEKAIKTSSGKSKKKKEESPKAIASAGKMKKEKSEKKKKEKSEKKKNTNVTKNDKVKKDKQKKSKKKVKAEQANEVEKCRDYEGNPCGIPLPEPVYYESSTKPPKNPEKSKKKKCNKSKKPKRPKKPKKPKKCVKPAKVSKTSPALIPYPNLDTNTPAKGKDCITSVFRVRVDPCDRLWVMDTGVADILGKFTIYSKPQILIYDLLTDKLIKKYVFEDKDTQENSFFANIVVDVEKDKCDEAFAYVPDLGSYGIVVYDMKKDKAWRIKHHYFHFDPLEGDYNVGGVNFQWTDGVFGIALTRPNPDGSKTAYFHALSSTSQFKVQTPVLQDEGESKSSNYTAYTLVGNKGPKSQTSASFIHESTGVMFYTQVNKDAVYCWNTDKPFSQENLEEVASDSTTMVFPNDLKVDYKNNLWVLTDKLPVFVTQGLDSKDVNYRIFVSPVAEAIKDTNCVP